MLGFQSSFLDLICWILSAWVLFQDTELKTKDKYKHTDDHFYRIGKLLFKCFILRLLFSNIHFSSLWIFVAEFENGVAEGKVDAALNPVAAVRLTVLKDSVVWAIVSEVSHASTFWLTPIILHCIKPYFISLAQINFSFTY